MAEYLPPTETVAIFDTLNFNDGDTPLTYNKAVKYFLRYPVAQGTETLQTTNVNGLLTANGNIKVQQIDSITPTGAVNLFLAHTGTVSVGNGFSTLTLLNTVVDVAAGTLKANTIESRANTTGASIYANQTTGNLSIATGNRGPNGNINIGTGSATNGGNINIGTGIRDITAQINIGTAGNLGASSAPVSINAGQGNAGTVSICSATDNSGQVNIASNGGSGIVNVAKHIFPAHNNTNQTLTSNGNTAGYDNVNTAGNCVLFSSSQTGQVSIANGQTTGRLFIGNSNRNSNGTAPTGEIGIGTGSATGSGTTGCLLNIGTGTRTIFSTINIGTGANDATSGINIGTGGTNAGNIEIASGASNSGNVNISTGATGTGNVFIGANGNTTGTTYLKSKNIELGANGDATAVISLSAPLRPNYASTASTNGFMLGYQTITTTSTTIPTSTLASVANTGPNLDNGVWLIEAQFGVTWTGTPVDSLIVWSVSTSATNDLTRMYTMLMNKNLISSQYNGRISTVIRLTGVGNTIHLVAQVNGSNPATSASAIRYTRIG